MPKFSKFFLPILLTVFFLLNPSFIIFGQAPPPPPPPPEKPEAPPPPPPSFDVAAKKALSANIISKQGKKGLQNPYSKEIITEVIYDDIKEIKANRTGNVFTPAEYWEKFYVAKKGSKYGVLNAKGEILLPIIYDKITDNYLVKDGKYGIVNLAKKTIIPFINDKLYSVDADRYFFKKKELWGLLKTNRQGYKVVLPAEYKSFDRPFLANYAKLVNKQNRIGIYDLKNQNFSIQPQYDFLEEMEIKPVVRYRMDKYPSTFFKIKENNKESIINQNGATIVPPQYDQVEIYGNGRQYEAIKIKKGNKYGLLKMDGQPLIPLKYDKIRYLNLGRFAVQLNGKYGMLNQDGRFLMPIIYDKISNFPKSFPTSMVVSGNKYGLADTLGKLLAPVNQKLPSGGGYEQLDDLYQGFVTALKSKDETIMRKFCQDISPDSLSLTFMIMNDVEYRGIPNELAAKGYAIDTLSKIYYNFLEGYQTKLENLGALADLTLIGPEFDQTEVFNEEHEILATETFIKLRSGTNERRAKLGELLRIDGVWKVFTNPKFR